MIPKIRQPINAIKHQSFVIRRFFQPFCLILFVILSSSCISDRKHHTPHADLIAFSYNRPMQLYALLESVKLLAPDFRKQAVIYRSDPEFDAGYAIVKHCFPSVHFYKQCHLNPGPDFKPLLLDLLFGEFGHGADYVVFAVDDIIVTDHIDLCKDIDKLNETRAYALYYRLASHLNYCYMSNSPQPVPLLKGLGHNYFTWNFSEGSGDWGYPNSVDFCLYRKEDIQEPLESINFTCPSNLEGNWAVLGTKNPVGLCCHRTKIINMPMNIVSEGSTCWGNRATHSFSANDLNRYFLEGFKIDIDSFYQVMNCSAHVDYTPDFIPRDSFP